MEQSNSVFMPGLTARGPVYGGSDGLLGAMPTVSPMVKYGIMAAVAYLGYKKKIPMAAALLAEFAVWKFLPDATLLPPPVAGLTADQQAAVDAANTAAASAGVQF